MKSVAGRTEALELRAVAPAVEGGRDGKRDDFSGDKRTTGDPQGQREEGNAEVPKVPWDVDRRAPNHLSEKDKERGRRGSGRPIITSSDGLEDKRAYMHYIGGESIESPLRESERDNEAFSDEKERRDSQFSSRTNHKETET